MTLMPDTKIHPTAVIDPRAEIDPTAEIGPYCVIGPKVKIGAGTVLLNHVTVANNTTIGANNTVHPYCVLGGAPQDLKFEGSDTRLVIGDNNTFRECCTFSIGTETGHGVTTIGSGTLLMAYCHIAHDCTVGDEVVMTNSVNLGGHVTIEPAARFAGLVGINPFVTVGTMAYIGGLSRIVQDVPPYMITEGNPARTHCINVVLLRRRDVPEDRIKALERAYRLIFRTKGRTRSALLDELEEQADKLSAEVAHLVEFLRAVERGKQGRANQP